MVVFDASIADDHCVSSTGPLNLEVNGDGKNIPLKLSPSTEQSPQSGCVLPSQTVVTIAMAGVA